MNNPLILRPLSSLYKDITFMFNVQQVPTLLSEPKKKKTNVDLSAYFFICFVELNMWPWRCFIQARESKWASSASPRASCAASQIWRKTFPAAVYVRNVTTIPYAFQFKGYSMVWLPAGPPTAARTCLLPERAFPHSKPLETPWLKFGSRGQRWRVNVCWHSGSLPRRQSGVWI